MRIQLFLQELRSSKPAMRPEILLLGARLQFGPIDPLWRVSTDNSVTHFRFRWLIRAEFLELRMLF